MSSVDPASGGLGVSGEVEAFVADGAAASVALVVSLETSSVVVVTDVTVSTTVVVVVVSSSVDVVEMTISGSSTAIGVSSEEPDVVVVVVVVVVPAAGAPLEVVVASPLPSNAVILRLAASMTCRARLRRVVASQRGRVAGELREPKLM